MKKVLIIGGTKFVGRNLLEKLIPLKLYDITLFNRGITNPNLFPEVKKIKGDRKVKADVEQLTNEYWDYVIDISGYWAGALEVQLALMGDNVGKYIYISTSSHYEFDTENPHPISETEAIVPCTDEQKHDDEMAFYNQNKAECERILASIENLKYIILRPGLIIGKHDHTDRLYYWFYKVQHQKKILVANNGENIISYTAVTDLVDVIIKTLQTNTEHKVYNVASFRASIAQFITLAAQKLNTTPQIVSVSNTLLEKHKVPQWIGLPLWLDGDFLITDCTRVTQEYQLPFKTIEQIVPELIHFYSEVKNWETPLSYQQAVSPQLEQEIIAEVTGFSD